jgi:hypothetical protein
MPPPSHNPWIISVFLAVSRKLLSEFYSDNDALLPDGDLDEATL